MKRILILAAHPDDEVLGCGGFVSKFSSKNITFRVLFLGEGSSCRFKDSNNPKAKKLSAQLKPNVT